VCERGLRIFGCSGLAEQMCIQKFVNHWWLWNSFLKRNQKGKSRSRPRTLEQTSRVAKILAEKENQEEIQGYCVRKTCGN
jgi:hypothetical protein